MNIQIDLNRIERVLDSCLIETQVYTVIDWIYRLPISEIEQSKLINKAQLKLESFGEKYDDVI